MPAKKSTSARKETPLKKVTKTTAERTGLLFPVSKVMSLMRKDRLNARIQKKAAIMMAGVLEYICAEIFENAGNYALLKGKKRLINRHLQISMSDDPELMKLMAGSIIF